MERIDDLPLPDLPYGACRVSCWAHGRFLEEGADHEKDLLLAALALFHVGSRIVDDNAEGEMAWTWSRRRGCRELVELKLKLE